MNLEAGTKLKKRKWVLWVGIWLGLSLAGLTLFTVLKFYGEIRAEVVTGWQRTQRAECGVVLTGGAGRVREGLDLLAQDRIKKLIIAGVYANSQLRDMLPMWSLYGNLKAADVYLERKSETTYGNAVQSLPIVSALQCKTVLLITSRLHMPRAYHTFRAIYPPEVQIMRQATLGSKLNPGWADLGLEILKSLFYQLWAY